MRCGGIIIVACFCRHFLTIDSFKMSSNNGRRSSCSDTGMPEDYIPPNTAPKCTWDADPTKSGRNPHRTVPV